ncbi:helix-turn-helix transcriptional regulator [Prescottella equi]|uniref:helix-turn-helix transcriptional regulator n=1 Tax=Rhodococcus hoagii TaxID=43767 RepID=UPI001C7983C3|nr:hypothetical protein [Prescottella equi]BCN44688.1 hypothetical protein RE9414_29680 [Prescottella equi]
MTASSIRLLDPDALLNSRDAAREWMAYDGEGDPLKMLRYKGKGPRFVRLGYRTVRYRRRDVLEWIAANVTDPGSA